MSGLMLENFWANKAACDDAERAYYEKLSGCKQQEDAEAEAEVEAEAPDNEEVDLFASDDEPAEAPVRVKPAGKSTNAKKDAKQAENKPNPAPTPASAPAPTPAPAPVPAPEPASKAPEAPVEDSFLSEVAKNPGLLRNPGNMERTFIMLKPDAVQRGLMGEIIERFESRGFKLVGMKLMLASQDLLKTHYSDLSKKPFFPELIRYMTSGPVVPMVFEGLSAVKQGRTMLGATNPKDSAPGTIRGDLCLDVGRNIIHGSDSVESANKEVALWFRPEELSAWRPALVEWLYEEEELDRNKPQPQPQPVDNLSSGLSAAEEMALMKKLGALEVENKELKKVTDDLKSLVLSLQARVDKLDGGKAAAAAPAPAAKAAPAPAEEEDDDDVDLFGSDEESDDEEKKRITEERLKAYHEKKSKKPKVIAKTSVLFDVKPWDDETDMDAMLKEVKTIEMEGLVWGASKLVPVGYGIKKLQVMCVVEDEKVSIDELSEKICEFEDFVQSVDIAAMSKI